MGFKPLKRGIFSKLVISYIVFSILICIGVMVCLLFCVVLITGGDTDAMSPYGVVDEDGNITNLKAVTNLDGWIEELDTDYKVVAVYGEKKTDAMQYTQDEIYYLISMCMGDDREYIGFLNTVRSKDKYFLCLYHRDVMQIQTTVMLDNSNGGGSREWFWVFAALFFVFFLMNCFFISLYLRKKIKKPLDALVSGMERFRKGEECVALTFATEAEFEQIRDTFNIMTEQLVREKKEKAEIMRKKDLLVLELSHDIKTPTATIKSCANALEAGVVPEDKMQEYYRTIDMKADRITKLSEDMFTLLKMENADYPIQLEQIDLCELLRKICAEYYEEISEAGFDFIIDIPETPYFVMVDCRLFTRVIGNLLLNALKYNQIGDTIRVFMQINSDKWNIEVLDDGEAIEEGLCLFDAFVRGDKVRRSNGGTGLGLAISKAIMERHHGSITYVRVGEENCFRVMGRR